MSDVPRIGPAPLTPDAHLVATLEELLAKAQSGELAGMAFIGYETDSNIRYGFVGVEMTGQYLRTYALLHWLANRAMDRWSERFETVPK